MEEFNEPGVFCEIMGTTPRNQMIEEIWTIQGSDFCATDLANDLEISKPTVYDFLRELESKDMIRPSRVIGKTQLYKVNKDNYKMKAMLKAVWECMGIVFYEAEHGLLSQAQKKMVVAEKKKKYKK